MGTSSVVTVTPIYWAPTGFSYPSTYQSLTEQFLSDVTHDDASSTNVFATLTQYTDASSNPIMYDITGGNAINDSHAYPPGGGCTADTGKTYSDGTGYSACLTDAQITTELSSVITANNLPSDLDHLYLVFLPKGVESCFTTANNAGGGTCTISAQGGAFCGYHSFSGSTIYSDLPYAIEDNPVTGGTCGSDGGRLQGNGSVGNQSPNSNLDADTVLSVTSHEMNEAISDPNLNAWWDRAGNEIGDDCAYIYGDSASFGGTSGSKYNQTINGDHYFIQEEFSNQEFRANSNFSCVQESLPQTDNFTSSAPTNAKQGGATYTPTATATSGLPVTITVDASSASVCAISSGVVSFPGDGTCTLDAKQPGNSTFVPAPQAQQSFTVAKEVAPSITTSSLPAGEVKSAYSATLAATGGVTPYAWSVSAGTLPAGLTLNSSTGAITGTPTTAGTSSVGFKVTDSSLPAQSATATIPITVNPVVSFTSTSLPAGAVGTSYSASLTAAGGTPPYSWSHTGTLPAGLSLNTSTGAITGTPTKAGTTTLTYKVADSSSPVRTASKSLKIVIGKGSQTITFTSTPPLSPPVGTTYPVRATASSGLTVAFSIDSTSTQGTCSYSALSKTVKFLKAGTCVIDAKQIGNVNYTAAPEVRQTVTVP